MNIMCQTATTLGFDIAIFRRIFTQLNIEVVTMSDVQSLVIEPLKQFYKDSKKLVEKCTKPDAKGEYFLFLWIGTFVSSISLCSASKYTLSSPLQRIPRSLFYLSFGIV